MEQDQETLIYASLVAMTKVLFLKGRLGARLCLVTRTRYQAPPYLW